jgi:DNA-binding NarL/FixJ family response regulator
MFRYGVAVVLASAPEIELVGEAADGAELITLVEKKHPDVVLTDLCDARHGRRSRVPPTR